MRKGFDKVRSYTKSVGRTSLHYLSKDTTCNILPTFAASKPLVRRAKQEGLRLADVLPCQPRFLDQMLSARIFMVGLNVLATVDLLRGAP